MTTDIEPPLDERGGHIPPDPRSRAAYGTPEPEVWITDLRAQPIGDGVLEIKLADRPEHGAALDAFEQHAIGREVVLRVDGAEHRYRCEVVRDDEGRDEICLIPVDLSDDLPDPNRFLETAFHLRCPW